MSTAATATESSPFRPVISHETLRFDYPDADLILRSPDSYEFRVLKTYIVHSSPMLEEKVLIFPNPQPEPTPTTPAVEDSSTNGLCIVELPIEGAILFSLLTYIFPVPPVLPSAVEHVMELLSVAQMYKMGVVLTHIRNHIAQRDPPLIRKETAFFIYSFSMTHNLRPEALQAAECTLSFASLAIDDLFKENVLDTMPIAFLPGFWKYHQRVQSNLSLGLKEFETSNALTVLGESSCESFTGIPLWVKEYISTIEIGRVTAFLDITDFHMALAEHTQTGQADNQGSFSGCASCSNIPRESIREIWRALTAAVRGSISKVRITYVAASLKEIECPPQAESGFVFPIEETRPEVPTREAASPPKYSNMLNADVILQSSDLVNFRVHKSVLAMSSPLFSDMFTLPQPPNGTTPDELPVVHVSEDSVVLNSLISMLYPVPPEMPSSSDDSLALLAAAAKYDMDTIRSSIRAEVSRKRLFSSTSAELFRVYAVAHRKKLIPEMAMAARLTLFHPLTLTSLGDALPSFEGSALRDLADFRLRVIRKFSALLLDCMGSSNTWATCKIHMPLMPVTYSYSEDSDETLDVPNWFVDLQSQLEEMDKFSQAIPTSQNLCEMYLEALQSHIMERDCKFCMKAHVMQGEIFCTKLKDVSTKARNVPHPLQEE